MAILEKGEIHLAQDKFVQGRTAVRPCYRSSENFVPHLFEKGYT